ncbi:MAG: hypothetical protein M1833_001870 [Piccolia ochrophora]|nr:MAG: hypothetical protein M1833_001870 [Piccolia ochrophora]
MAMHLAAFANAGTVLSSTALRIAVYVFLRWIPGHHFPPIIYTLVAIYIPSFITSYLNVAPYTVVSDEINVTHRDGDDDSAMRKNSTVREDTENTTTTSSSEEGHKEEHEATSDHDGTSTGPASGSVENNDGDALGTPSESVHPQETQEIGNNQVKKVRGWRKSADGGEEIDLEETVILEEQGPRTLRTLLTGFPSPTSSILSFVTAGLNVLLTLIVIDFIYRGPLLYPSHDLAFARVGSVVEGVAKILIREPNPSNLPLYLSYRKISDEGMTEGSWKSAGAVYSVSNATDFTAALRIAKLEHDTRYQYVTSTNYSGFFTTGPFPGRQPQLGGQSFTFVTSSCIKPRFPYNPFDHPLALPGLRMLARRLPELNAQFMLFLGDFIYVDVPRRLGIDYETYRREYRMAYSSPDWPPASQELPWIHVLDDHEIANDWDANTTGVYPAAADPWHHYHTSVNPPEVRRGASYFSFISGPASFFMLDTRRYRSPELAAPRGSAQKTMLGKEQLADLLIWLRKAPRPGVRWKIVVSSVPFTKNWRFGDEDSWAGYLAERKHVLEAMWDIGSRTGVGVVILSGDRHEFAATKFPPPEGSKWDPNSAVHEFSTSPLSQFYLPIRTYRQSDDQDVAIKYIPDGNSKFGVVEITDHKEHAQSQLRFRLFVDGSEAWNYTHTVFQ